MLRLYLFSFILLVVLQISCHSISKSDEQKIKDGILIDSIPKTGRVDNDFNVFIENFNTDPVFQKSRTKFPLKISFYDIVNNRDTIFYTDKSGFKELDFSKKKSNSQYDQWEQIIVVEENQQSAKIEIRGIENGIMVDYMFEKINDMWMLVEVNDSST